MGRKWTLIAILACIAVGSAGALDARAFLIVPAACGLVWLCVLAYNRPQHLLPVAVFLVLVAGTKFRNRDPTASLANVLDGQIILELAIFGLIALILGMAILSPSLQTLRLKTTERLLIAFVVLAACSVLWSSAPMLTVVRTVQLAILLALGLIASRVMGASGTLRAVGVALTVYVLVCAALATAFPWAQGLREDAQGRVRFSWFAMHSISASTLTAVAILYVLCIALFAPDGWKRRWVGVPIVLLFLPLGTIMVAANSRGPLFALVGTICALLAFRYLHPVTTLTLVATGALLVLVGTVYGVTPESLLAQSTHSDSRVAEMVLRGQTVSEFGTLTGRTELWVGIMPYYFDRPLFGYGYQASRSVLLAVRPWAGHAHNALIQSLMDLGLVGAVLLWIPFARALFARPPARARARSVTTWQSATVFAFAMFALLTSVSDVAFAGPPGYETLLVFCSIAVVERMARDEALEDAERSRGQSASARFRRAVPLRRPLVREGVGR